MSGQDVQAHKQLEEQTARVKVYDNEQYFLFGRDTVKEAREEIKARGHEIVYTHATSGRVEITVNPRPIELIL